MISRAIQLAILTIFLAGARPAFAEPIRVGVIDYPPFAVLRSDGGISGSIPDMIRVAYASVDRKVEFEIMPLARLYSAAQAGRIDAVFAARPATEDRLLLSEHPVAILRQTFYVRNTHDWTYTGLASLEGQVVATVAGYDYSTIDPEYQYFLDQSPSVITISSSKDYLDRIARMLRHDRIDVFNEDASVMNYRLSRLGLKKDMRMAGRLGPPNPLHVAFKPDAAGLALKRLFDRGYIIARNAGSLDYIASVYGVSTEP